MSKPFTADTDVNQTVQAQTEAAPQLQRIAILDCGAQYTKVIDRRIRELNVATELYPIDVDPALLREGNLAGLILSGGPNSVYDADAPQCDPAIFELGVPVLGICYGMQLMSQHFGGTVEQKERREYGETLISVDVEHPVFKELDAAQQVLMSHGDSVTRLPDGFKPIAESVSEQDGRRVQIHAAIAHESKPFVGFQFHPEVELTENGERMLANFLFELCQVEAGFDLCFRLEQTLEELRSTVGNNPVFVLVSGGVDSSVVAALLLKALGPEQVYGLHVDTGLMRHHESDLVCNALQALGFKHLKRLDMEQAFLKGSTQLEDGTVTPRLCDATDPEQKRRIIGDVFFRVLDAEMQALREQFARQQGSDKKADQAEPVFYMAQGTLRPDLIESGNKDVSKKAHKIKTHHNDVPVIQELRERGLVLEPNRDLHKDEVRRVGRMLGLPEALVARQPFPGPGLGVRMICAEEPYGLDDYDAVNEALRTLLNECQQSDTSGLLQGLRGCVLPIRSVGVQGDGRTYAHVAAIEVPGYDNTASFARLRDVAQEITNRLKPINRVALNLRPKASPLPEQSKTITPTFLRSEAIERLRQVDALVTEAFDRYGASASISQLLSVLVPVDPGLSNKHSVVIRGVVTSDFMTARAARVGQEIPEGLLPQLADTIAAQDGIALVLYDITSKPPATVEWE